MGEFGNVVIGAKVNDVSRIRIKTSQLGFWSRALSTDDPPALEVCWSFYSTHGIGSRVSDNGRMSLVCTSG